MTRIKHAEYFEEKYEITDGTATNEGIKIIFERHDKSIYERPYSVAITSFSLKEMVTRQVIKFKSDISEIYRIFVNDKLPEINASSIKELANQFIQLLIEESKKSREESIKYNQQYETSI